MEKGKRPYLRISFTRKANTLMTSFLSQQGNIKDAPAMGGAWETQLNLNH